MFSAHGGEAGLSFRHGVHPDDHKDATSALPVERMPFVERYVLPLGQHIGAPSRAVVERGAQVQRGQLIAEPGGWVSTALHSPVTGRVAEISRQRAPSGELVPAIVIDADPYADQVLDGTAPTPTDHLERKALAAHVQLGGIVGLGGAAFPSHVKYLLPGGKVCDHLVLNGCECEPYLTCDHRTMVERADAIIRGAAIVARQLGASRTTIGVERNKPDAIDALKAAIPAGAAVTVVPLRVKYPQGAEKMLIHAVVRQEVPAGRLPLDLGIVVNNVGTMAAVADWFDKGFPLIERVVTVSGPGIERPSNLVVPIGTPIREVLRFCGGLRAETRQVVMGGPMMGQAVMSLDAPVLKGTSGLLAFTQGETGLPTEYSCVRCGRCLEACANFLNPSRLARLARAGRHDAMEAAFVKDCMECGACSFTCPSGIPIVQLIRASKAQIRKNERDAK